jgi:hypothetical protein
MSGAPRWKPVAAALRVLADAVEQLDDEIGDGHVDQAASPLGRRRHCGAVRRRIARGDGGAFVVGRRHLLTKEALAAEMAAGLPRKHASSEGVAAELMRELRLVGGRLAR